MTLDEATHAMDQRLTVEAGIGADHDTGTILSLDDQTAWVAWRSGVRTTCPIAILSVVTGGEG